MADLIKLNLGCGAHPLEGYVNVDKVGRPDVCHDLETFPWPWDTSSVREVVLKHVLEHLGQTPEVFLRIMQELYRVCSHEAKVLITVPHPRHDYFLGDPTHVRPITPEVLSLFSKRMNHQWISQGGSNTPLALTSDVDFETVQITYVPDPAWTDLLAQGTGPDSPIVKAARQYNNVIKETQIVLRVIKEGNAHSQSGC